MIQRSSSQHLLRRITIGVTVIQSEPNVSLVKNWNKLTKNFPKYNQLYLVTCKKKKFIHFYDIVPS